MSKRLSKYIASFDYFDKSSIALSIRTGSISVASFLISTGIIKKLLRTTRKKKENIIKLLW